MAMKTQTKQKHRLRKWTEQGGKCVFCNRPMWILGVHPIGKKQRQATIEHIIPKAFGGTNHPSNLACSCSQCNNLRGTLPFDTFKHVQQFHNYHRLISRMRSTTKYTKPDGFYILEHIIWIKRDQIKAMVKKNEQISTQPLEK